MKAASLFATLLALAACGVDGPPRSPEPTHPGVTVTGAVKVGVSGGL